VTRTGAVRGVVSLVLVGALLGGCASVPSGPSVMVLPGTGKSFEQFQADDSICRQWASQQVGTTVQSAATESTAGGAVIGTLGSGFPGALTQSINTTPDAIALHCDLARYRRQGAQAAVMEVSSIGLDQGRVNGVAFDVAVFTNLTRDHLEYHHTLRRYQDAKARLFAWETLRHAVVNLDDDFGTVLARRIRRPGLDVVGYGFGAASGACSARVQGANLATGAHGVAFDVMTCWGSAHVASPVLGRHNAYNLLGTLAVLLAGGIPLRRAVAALSVVKPVPGRLQRLGGGAKPMVVVDYAHTPDALSHALATLREVLTNRPAVTGGRSRLICVFGCGGDRDRGKRPLMGRVAQRLADRVVLTSDNPRNEDPRDIIKDIVRGTRGTAQEIVIEANRRRAIRRGAQSSRPTPRRKPRRLRAVWTIRPCPRTAATRAAGPRARCASSAWTRATSGG